MESNNKHYLTFYAGLLLLLAFPAFAATSARESVEDLTKLPFEQLVDMEVLTASRLAQQLSDAPSAVAVVTAQDIKDYGYHTLADVLNSMRGLYITNDHAFDYLGGRGFSRPGDYAGRVLLLIDGYASNDNIYNQIYLDNSGLLDTELIERVEYVPGTGSVLYGNNAFFGIISVTTKNGRDFNGLQMAGDAYRHDGRKGRATFGKQLDNGADLLFSLSMLRSDGQNIFFPEFNAPATNNGVAENLDGEQSNRAFAKLHFEKWMLEAGYVSRRKAVPTTLGGVPFNAYNLFRDNNGFLRALYDTDLSSALKSSTHIYSGYYLDHGVYDLAAGTERAYNRGQWWGVDQKVSYTGMENHKMIFGAEYRDDFSFNFSNIAANFDKDRQTFSLYAQDEIALNHHWMLNVGARYDRPSDVSDNVSPRIALIYSPSPETTIKASYSTAFRMPAAIEKFNVSSSQVSNPNLDSEEVATMELVLRHEFSPDFSFTGSLYRYRTHDLIASTTLASGFDQFTNIGNCKTGGLEMELEKVWHGDVRLRTSYAYQDAEDTQGRVAVNAPKNLAKFNLSLPLTDHRIRAGMELQYTGSRLTEARHELGSYSLVNLTVTADRFLPNLSLSASLRNLFDKHVLVVAPSSLTQDVLEMQGRDFWLNLTYDFK